MLNEENQIDENSVAKWHLDCVSGVTSDDIFEMCLRHYSCVKDGVYVYTAEPDAGLGSTYLENINSIGIEINPAYFELCRKLVSQSEYQQLSFN